MLKLSVNSAILSATINAKNGNVDGVIEVINSCEEKISGDMRRYYEIRQAELLNELTIVTEIVKRLRGW